ncbi:magnesium/cobalt transporter CorA [Cryomorpha ignava]|uniref:Magnesium transport protein CorA n=1 Tax=Cryomorpha ignava TaxID=101383 RepID=A0A7K3WW47_9FLAO|nr:magnesium/cobalt transporter CorA [Cryomorpha ignava]NEN24825.1 magnesium/cobalt transporter CorA [Cryomorpha ignava]
MAKFVRKESKKIGAAPGSLIFVGAQKSEKVSIDVIKFDQNGYETFDNIQVDAAAEYLSEKYITWYNITGLHDTSIIAKLGEIFTIHPLILEDVLNTNQRSKFDQTEDRLAFFLKMLRLESDTNLVETEQVAIVIGPNFLLSFQEMKGDVFEGVRNRIINTTTKIRTRGSDYLAFALMDAIVDNYVITIEHLGNQIESLVEEMLKSQNKKLLNLVNVYRRDTNSYRRTIRPVLELAIQFEKTESPLLSKKTIPFIKDLQDHVQHANEAIEIYKELLNDELGIFHMNMGARLNDILRVLTIFSVVFIPLTFVAGVYGTNFEYLPELHYKYAYPLFWLLLIIITAGMLYYFKNKKWL